MQVRRLEEKKWKKELQICYEIQRTSFFQNIHFPLSKFTNWK